MLNRWLCYLTNLITPLGVSCCSLSRRAKQVRKKVVINFYQYHCNRNIVFILLFLFYSVTLERTPPYDSFHLDSGVFLLPLWILYLCYIPRTDRKCVLLFIHL